MRREIKGKHQHYNLTSDLQAFSSQVTIKAARIREYKRLKFTLRKLNMNPGDQRFATKFYSKVDYNKAYKKDNPLRFQIEGFLLLGCVGVKFSSPNISFRACSCSSKPTSFATRVALSMIWSISVGLVHKRWTSCNLLLVPFNGIPHLRKRFSLSSLVSLFCMCRASICLS